MGEPITTAPTAFPTATPAIALAAHEPPSAPLAAALEPQRWATANRELTAKILTELLFEEILAPGHADDPEGHRHYELPLPDGSSLRFVGHPRFLGHHRVVPDSVTRTTAEGTEVELLDVAELVALAAPPLGAKPETTAGAIGELAATLLADVGQLATGRPVLELLDLDNLELEGQLRGHPWIVANKGRIGFSADDLARYAPEAGQRFGLHWLAVAPGRADVATVTGLDHRTVVADQLGPEGFAWLVARTEAAGLDPATATWLPVHPWQWANRILPLHAGDLARGRLAHLGVAPPRYLPQQSIRTLVDADHRHRRYLKVPLAILNTSVYRGLPRDRAVAAPALTEWFTGRCAADPFLVETGLVLLGEVASVSVAHQAFEVVPQVPYQHTELLGCIWRDSVEGHLRPGERAVTMAALLHRDPQGRSYAAALIRRSGLAPGEWVRRLHECTLPPLVHVLYRHGAAFSPHAQNCMVVLVDDVPVRLVVKDFVDDVQVASDTLPEIGTLPDAVRRALGGGIEARILVQWIQGGLLVCVHRYLSEILLEELGYPEGAFWAEAEAVLRRYQDRFYEELVHRYDLFDLDAPSFVKLCLNRVRLLERGYADDAERPLAAAVGWIDNPLALGDLDDGSDDGDPDGDRTTVPEAEGTP